MGFRRVFYANGDHDEIPVDAIVEDGLDLVFMFGAKEAIRVLREDVVTIEDR